MVSKSLKEEEAALHPQIIHLSSTLLATVGSAKPLGACCEPWCRLERPSSGHSSSSSGCREYHLNSSRGLIVLELIYFFSHCVFQSQITMIWLFLLAAPALCPAFWDMREDASQLPELLPGARGSAWAVCFFS